MSFIDKINDSLASMQNIKIKDKLIFYRLLATMTNAWMTLVKSIKVLRDQEKNPVMKKMLWVFVEELKWWKNLSECLELYPWSFNESEIGIISSWEKTWKLNKILVDLADQIEKISSISWKLKSAMIYPAFIIVVVLWVIAIMMIKIVPKLLDIFEDKSKLPVSTQTLMAFSDFLGSYWIYIILFTVIFIIFISIWKKTPGWKYMFDRFLLSIPIFGWLNQKIVLSKFSRLLSWLISSWISIISSFEIVATWVGNEVYRQRILLIKEDVQQWIKIWESIDWDKLFPQMMVQMIKVGEETANIDTTILKVADFYDEQVDNIIRTLNKLLEPAIIVFLAVAVGWIAMAIMQPIMQLADTVSNT